MAWPPAPEALSTAQLSRYLTYVGLDPDATLARPRDRALLAAVQRAHLLRVPFDTTALHIPSAANEASDTPFTFGRGPGMPLALGAMFTRVVDEARGGYCFLMNTLFAAVLRAIGFTVKECLARAHPQHIRPWQDGWAWQSATHSSLIVDCADGGRHVVDVGYGAGTQPPEPITFTDGAAVVSIAGTETFVLRQEVLPGLSPADARETTSGWTVYRHFRSSDNNTPGMPMYHFTLHPMAPGDFLVLNHWSTTYAHAPFAKVLRVGRLRNDGSRELLEYAEGAQGARLYTRDGVDGRIIAEEDVPLTDGALLRVCRERFGFA